jgi:hypothetical protein
MQPPCREIAGGPQIGARPLEGYEQTSTDPGPPGGLRHEPSIADRVTKRQAA